MEKIAIIFGGAGYIGRNLVTCFLEQKTFSKYIVADIQQPHGLPMNESVRYVPIDVRNPVALEIGNVDVNSSWIFNLAAIHREPGHTYKEYFDTNIPGAKHINEFARKSGIKNMFFTSSIAPYGRSLEVRTEDSPLYPETAYGISKALAEEIHKQWFAETDDRKLIIVRPSVIFGPNDPGNVYRMIKALKKGTFILPNGGNVIKGYGYIFGLIDSILFTMHHPERLITYNYAEYPLVPLKDMVALVKREFNYKKPTISLSTNILAVLALFLQFASRIAGLKSDIHPVRVKKAAFPTNIHPQFLIKENFEFKFDFRAALKHWKTIAPEEF